jgi:uncharacterized protein YkwD
VRAGQDAEVPQRSRVLGRSCLKLDALAISAALLVCGFASLAADVPVTRADDRYAEGLEQLVNQYRDRQGVAPLAVDRNLAALAREHSTAMAASGRLSHDGFESRVQRSGRSLCVENVGWNYQTPKEQLDGWRRSSVHDRNLLDARVERMGIGVASGFVTYIACRQPISNSGVR